MISANETVTKRLKEYQDLKKRQILQSKEVIHIQWEHILKRNGEGKNKPLQTTLPIKKFENFWKSTWSDEKTNADRIRHTEVSYQNLTRQV